MVNIRKIKQKLNIQDYLYASFNMSNSIIYQCHVLTLYFEIHDTIFSVIC